MGYPMEKKDTGKPDKHIFTSLEVYSIRIFYYHSKCKKRFSFVSLHARDRVERAFGVKNSIEHFPRDFC